MAKQNLRVYRGTTYNMTYTHPEDMTGGTLYFTVKAAAYDSSATDDSAIIAKDVSSFTNGGLTASWQLTDSDTFIDPESYNYSIVFEDAAGETLPPIFEGKFKVLPHATNRNV